MPGDSSGVYIEERKVVHKNAVDHLILPTRYATKILANATPTVSNIHMLIPLGVANTITNFSGGSENQSLNIKGDGVVIIANNTTIKTNTGANKILSTNKIYTFFYISGIWYEHA